MSSKEKKRKSSSESSRRVQSSELYGAFEAVDLELGDIHQSTTEDVLKALATPAIKRKKRDKTKDKGKHRSKDRDKKARTDKEEKEKALKRQLQKETEAATKLGILNLVKVPKKLRDKFKTEVHAKQKELFEFLLLTIAPIELSLDPAADDATEAMRIITGAQDVEISLGKSKAMLDDLVSLKMLKYLSKSLGLGSSERKVIIQKHFNTTPKNAGNQELLRQLLRTSTHISSMEKPVGSKSVKSGKTTGANSVK